MKAIIRFLIAIIFFISLFTCAGCLISLFSLFNCWFVQKLGLELAHLVSGSILTFLICVFILLTNDIFKND
ncbi:MAG TPA: hypothetical protein ENG63_00960 [Candidatus Desulfofervidus auxilii]|uniref:Uncharacterized protein n=1 Tax=Desulfofervidus auxilii TaxID=1621989 RepID=A0A7C0U1D2_DESA2|nr:hypothetical protein [Candidatus Desulfofervidus auxilii]